jgi:hypothetical protein
MKIMLSPQIVFNPDVKGICIDITRFGEKPIRYPTDHSYISKEIIRIFKQHQESIKDAYLIIDSANEWWDPNPYVKSIIESGLIDKEKIRVRAGAKHDTLVPTEIIYTRLCNQRDWYDLLQKENIDWKNINVDQYFLSLARIPKIPRARMMKLLLDHIPQHLKCSFGIINDTAFGNSIVQIKTTRRNYENCRALMHPHDIPIIIDQHETDTIESTIHPPNYEMYTCLCNLIMETTIDHMFITEKTYKAFAWHQIPIWWAGVGTVDEIRKLGFDTFDDLMYGHEYDIEKHPNVRMHKILKTVKKFINDNPDINLLRQSIWSRLEANNKRLSEIVENDKLTYDNWDSVRLNL